MKQLPQLFKDNSLWRRAKCVTKHLSKKQHKIRCFHGSNVIVYSDQEKPEVLANNFKKLHHLTKEFGDRTLEREVFKEMQKN